MPKELDMGLTNISNPHEVKEKLHQVIDWIGDSEKLYFSQRREISIALLRLAGEFRAVITPPVVNALLGGDTDA